MAGRRKNTGLKTLVKWIVIIFLIVTAGKWIVNFIAPECTDVTDMTDMKTEELEAALQISMVRNSDMSKKINQYSEGQVSVDSADGIGVVYIDGRHTGLHIDSRRYSMYGLHIGDPELVVEDRITYEYGGCFEVINDMFEGHSTASFYYNKKRGDCLTVICNDHSHRIVALTYFNDLNKVTESLSGF